MTTWPLDNTQYTAQAIGAYGGARTRGVYSSDDCFAVSAIGEFNIKVEPGLAWLKKEKYWGVAVQETLPTILALEVGSGELSRQVAVVLQLDKTANEARLTLKYGDYEQQAPLPVRDDFFDEITIAICTQNAGAAAITSADITDTRADESLCGIMRDGVTGIPTEAFNTQANAIIKNLQSDIASVKDGSAYSITINDTATFLKNNWSADAPYTQTVSAINMAEIYEPFADLICEGTAEEIEEKLEAYANVSYMQAQDGTITATCLFDKPLADFKVKLKAVV